MWETNPDISLALAAYPPEIAENKSKREIIEESHKNIKQFYSLLRDHDAFSQTTLAVLANRWGIIDPPEPKLFPRIWLLGLYSHLDFLDCSSGQFEAGLAAYLSNVVKYDFSFTEWIFRHQKRKRIIWISRRVTSSRVQYRYLSKDDIFQIIMPARRLPMASPYRKWEEPEVWKDNVRFLWMNTDTEITGEVLPLPQQVLLGGAKEALLGKKDSASWARIIGELGAPNEDFIKDMTSKLHNLLLMHNSIPCWTDIIYIPSSGNKSGDKHDGGGGIILFEKLPDGADGLENRWFRWTLDRIKHVHSAVQQFYSFFIRQDNARISRYFATRSAMSAIMSRNLSHNIGSHVLSAIGESYIKSNPRQVHEFNYYLQRRMDFLARIVGDRPGWGEPMLFIGDLLNEFFSQSLLLGNLIADIGTWEIIFELCLATGKKHRFVYDNDIKKWKCSDSIDDFLVSIPDGLIGAQAFFVFLESMIRNSAKYGKGKMDQHTYVIRIDVEEKAEHYKLTVCDNFSRCDGDLVSTIQDKIKEPIVDSHGVISTRSLGIAEMREACNFLIHPCGEDYPAFKDKQGNVYPLWSECPSFVDCGTGTVDVPERCAVSCDCNHLTYTFNLAKPLMLGLVNYHCELPGGSNRNGIHKIDYKMLVTKKGTFQFVIIYDANDEIITFINKNAYALPQRILLVNHNVKESPYNPFAGKVTGCRAEEICTDSTAEQMIISVYEAWIRNKWLINDCAHLYITSEREVTNDFFTKWKPRIEQTRVLIDRVKLSLIKTAKAGNKEVVRRDTEIPEDTICLALLYDNHKRLSQDLSERTQKRFFVHDTGSNNKKIFETISAPPAGNFAFDFFLLGLIEAALTRVIIIDERVASNSIRTGKYLDCEPLLELNDCQCFPVLFLDGKRDVGITDKVKIQFDSVADNCRAVALDLDTIRKMNADFVIVHYGLMETHQQILGQIEQLNNIARSVVIATGRGAGTIKDEFIRPLPFLEFSAIQSNCYPSISKYHLVRALMSTKGGIQ